ncbi:MAG: hypothetical protein GYB64_19575 [Chloroflexi bacterium]|nr:hypothetical protein [Chloroflexota bacterium]
MEIELKTYPIQLLTSHYMITGSITPRGNPSIFLNDPRLDVYEINSATINPLEAGTPVATITVPTAYVPRGKTQVIILGDYTVDEAQPMPKTEVMAVFTDTYLVHGHYHMAQEVTGSDLFFVQKGPMYPVTRAEIYTLRPIREPIGGEADLLYINGELVESFYLEEA